jgi:chromosomal replication initiator protein
MYRLSSEETTAIWQQVCAELELALSPAVFNTWIRNNPLTELSLDDTNKAVGIITSPTAFHANNIKKNLYAQIKSSLDKVLEKDTSIEFLIGTPVVTTQSHQQSETSHLQSHQVVSSAPLPNSMSAHDFGSTLSQTSGYPATSPVPESAPAMTSPPAQQPQPFRSTTSSGSPRVEDLFSQHSLQNATVDRALTIARQVGLKPDFTFETFAVSTTNEMAHAAATAVSNRPGTAYNPLFLYGGVGVGKTHLMHAIGNNILKHFPDLKILYCTGEEFTNEIVSAIQNKKAIKFKEKYRTAQVMLIDDVQFIAGKNAVQEEFFHTFNALTQQARQIVMTSDRPPHEINLLEDRLRSRFEAGLMIDIQQPSFELRTAILLIKSSAVQLHIPMDLAQLIASKVDSARKIQGIISSIRSEVELKKRVINAELIDEILQTESVKKRPSLKVSPSDVVKTVANHYRLKQAAIKGQQRHQPLVHARHVAMYLLKEDLNMPLTEIGRWFSNRDHTSALHAVKKIELEVTNNELLQRDISALRMSLTAISR